MLVIISDLHLTDGTSGSTISAGAFEVLSERLADLGYSASRRSDGTYRPVERVDLVLLGDVIDIIRSSAWLHAGVRPWDDVQSPVMVDTVSSIVDGTFTWAKVFALRSTDVKVLPSYQCCCQPCSTLTVSLRRSSPACGWRSATRSRRARTPRATST